MIEIKMLAFTLSVFAPMTIVFNEDADNYSKIAAGITIMSTIIYILSETGGRK